MDCLLADRFTCALTDPSHNATAGARDAPVLAAAAAAAAAAVVLMRDAPTGVRNSVDCVCKTVCCESVCVCARAYIIAAFKIVVAVSRTMLISL